MTIYFLLATMILCNVTGNILLKTGAVNAALARATLTEAGLWREVLPLLNPQVIAGTTAFATGMLFYLYCLQKLPLNVVQSFAAAQFVGTVMASAFLLSEQIGYLQWVGIVMITGGIVLVGWSQA
jgi:drug/metabolite transporter (DMT)-like permease